MLIKILIANLILAHTTYFIFQYLEDWPFIPVSKKKIAEYFGVILVWPVVLAGIIYVIFMDRRRE